MHVCIGASALSVVYHIRRGHRKTRKSFTSLSTPTACSVFSCSEMTRTQTHRIGRTVGALMMLSGILLLLLARLLFASCTPLSTNPPVSQCAKVCVCAHALPCAYDDARASEHMDSQCMCGARVDGMRKQARRPDMPQSYPPHAPMTSTNAAH